MFVVANGLIGDQLENLLYKFHHINVQILYMYTHTYVHTLVPCSLVCIECVIIMSLKF